MRMEKRTRILLGRSVKRKEARENVRLAFAAAKKAPQGAGYVALEEALAEARAVGADTSTSYGTGGPKGFQGGSEAEAMLSEIRAEARAAEASALAAALTSNCLQVPVDIKGLEANLKRARGVIAKTERDAAAVDASRSVDAIQRNIKDEATAKAVREWNESAAVASDILSSADASASALDTDDSTTVTREGTAFPVTQIPTPRLPILEPEGRITSADCPPVITVCYMHHKCTVCPYMALVHSRLTLSFIHRKW